MICMSIVDGKNPAIASATTGGKVLIHQPWKGNSGGAAEEAQF